MIVRRDPASGLVRLAGVVAAVPVLGAFPATAGAQQDPVPICHFTGSQTNPYVLVTVPPEGVVEHRAHPRDIIPAPSGGCPGAPVDPTPTPTPVPTATPTPGPEGVAICHATGAAGVRRYVRVVVPAADAERHRGHAQDLVPAPAGGCPIGPRDDRPPPVPPDDGPDPGPGPPAAGPGAVAPGEAADRPAPVSQANSLNAMRQLPKTGGEALVLALVGAGFVLAGLGVRLRYG